MHNCLASIVAPWRSKDPLSFIPERWLPEDEEYQSTKEELKNLKEVVLPLSLGPRAGVGRNLAYMEVSITMATLVLAFEWELAVPGIELIERFNCNPKELLVKLKGARFVDRGVMLRW